MASETSRTLTTVQALIQNAEDVLELQKHIAQLTRIFQRWYGAHELPSELKTRIKTFFECVHILMSYP
jgi:hypothetical protein